MKIRTTAAIVAAIAITNLAAAAPIDFERDVRPLLARCTRCHGADEQQGGLRLDDGQLAAQGGDSGPVIVPRRSGESEILGRVASTDADQRMPPDGPGLKASEVAVLRQWIDEGASWPATAATSVRDPRLEHWAWQTLVRPAVPASKPDNWSRGPVDQFILARLEAEKLRPAPEADRSTLIRRLSFDLIGLPPTPEEVEAFVADARPDAYERLVDRLLDSVHYGERWARHWLDLVHFGETHGYDKDQPRPNAWRYRDYVIRALNADRPYGRFIEEQVAGDVLYPDSPDATVALGMLAAGPWDLIGHMEVPETKRDGRIARHLDRDDMVATVIGTFNSLTIHCAQCHAHKFDPIPQEDYYRLQAVFAALDRADKPYYADPAIAGRQRRLLADQQRQKGRRAELAAAVAAAGGAELAAIDARLAHRAPASQAPEFGYHSLIADRAKATKWVQVDLGGAHDLAEIVLVGCHDDFNNIGDGFGFPPRYRVELSNDPNFTAGVMTVVDRTSADNPNPGTRPERFRVDARARYVRVTAVRLAPRKNDFIFSLAELEAIDVLGNNVARGKQVTSLDSIEAPPRWRRANLVDGLLPASSEMITEQKRQLAEQRERLISQRVAPAVREELARVERELAATSQALAKLPPPEHVYAATVHEGKGNFLGTGAQGGKPRPIHVLRRGDVDRPAGPPVAPGALSLVRAMPASFELPADHREGQRRAALAHWLSSKDNPLTWRSIANRLWQHHFGRGLVDSPNDFGRMGQLPSHPELLDWLACELRDGGGSLKRMHRLLVTSGTYRQSSTARPESQGKTTTDALYARMNRRRLDAESLRDAMLSIAGKLDPAVGGPSFQDFAVEHPEHSPHYEYDRLAPDDPRVLRRSIYRFVVRSQPQPWMTAMDCADPSLRVDKRNESLSPLQALAMLNDGFVLTMAEHFAGRIEITSKDQAARVQRAFYMAIGRPPRTDEQRLLENFAHERGLANLCRLLVNMNEFVFVD